MRVRRTGGRVDGRTGPSATESSLAPAPLPACPPVRLSALAALRRVLGMPDYAGYLAHLRAHHPDRPVPTEREFYDQYLRTRYGDGATRCC